MKHQQKSYQYGIPWFSYGYWNCMFVNTLTKSIEFFLIVFTNECGVVHKIQRRSLNSLNVCLTVFVSWSTPSDTTIKYRDPSKKNNWITPTFLKPFTTPFVPGGGRSIDVSLLGDKGHKYSLKYSMWDSFINKGVVHLCRTLLTPSHWARRSQIPLRLADFGGPIKIVLTSFLHRFYDSSKWCYFGLTITYYLWLILAYLMHYRTHFLTPQRLKTSVALRVLLLLCTHFLGQFYAWDQWVVREKWFRISHGHGWWSKGHDQENSTSLLKSMSNGTLCKVDLNRDVMLMKIKISLY